MFNIWVPVMSLPKDQFPCDKQLVENRNHWKRQLDKQKEGADNLLTTTPAPAVASTTAATTTSTAPSGTLPPPSQAVTTTAVVPVSVAAPQPEVRLTLIRADSRPPASGSASVAPAPIGGISSDRRKSSTGITISNGNGNGGNTNRGNNESKMQRHDSHH
jgi:hypothetical protein